VRTYLNSRLVRRNNFLGKALLFSGLGVLAVGFLVSLSSPQQQVAPFLLVAVVGMTFSQVGTLLMTRWSRSPRADEVLDGALKGLDDRHALFHYFLGAPHALFTPSGVYALVPAHEDGDIVFTDGTWIRSTPRRGIFRPARRESLTHLRGAARKAEGQLAHKVSALSPDGERSTVRPLLVFVNPVAQLKAPETDPPAVHIKKLKEWIRRQPKTQAFPAEKIDQLGERLTAGRQAV
jgi:hypothetical protein